MKPLKTIRYLLLFLIVTTLICCKQETNTTITTNNIIINNDNQTITWNLNSAKDTQYMIQLSDTKDFKSVVHEKRGLKSNEYKIPAGKLKNGTYYCRVGEDGGGNIEKAQIYELNIAFPEVRNPKTNRPDSKVLLKEGLIAYYPFNGNANDESGNGKNGVVHGSTLTLDRFGNENCAYSFNGINNHIEILNTENMHFENQDFTISAWLNFSSKINDDGILTHHVWSGKDGAGWFLNVFDNKLTFSYGKDIRITANDKNYNDGKWHFLVGTYNGTTKKLYVDGLIKGEQSLSVLSPCSTNIHIGSCTTGNYVNGETNGYFKGMIDDIRIYSRALSSSEIDELYHEGGW